MCENECEEGRVCVYGCESEYEWLKVEGNWEIRLYEHMIVRLCVFIVLCLSLFVCNLIFGRVLGKLNSGDFAKE